MDLNNLHVLSASEAARLIRDGVISSEQLVEACLARVREVDEQVQAWTFLDPDYALWISFVSKENRLARCTACRSASRTSSTPPTCRLRTAPSFTRVARRRAMPQSSRCCARWVR